MAEHNRRRDDVQKSTKGEGWAYTAWLVAMCIGTAVLVDSCLDKAMATSDQGELPRLVPTESAQQPPSGEGLEYLNARIYVTEQDGTLFICVTNEGANGMHCSSMLPLGERRICQDPGVGKKLLCDNPENDKRIKI